MQGIDPWIVAVRDRGALATSKWLIRRSIEVELDEELVLEALENMILAEDPGEAALACAELAEIVQVGDLELADLLWFSVRDYAISVNDPELIVDSTTQIAEIAFELDEVTTAGEVWIDFLNWRREPESTSDAETVLIAFDEIIRSAEMDGAHGDAAKYGYLQVQFQKLVDAEDRRATVGNWMPDQTPFVGWE